MMSTDEGGFVTKKDGTTIKKYENIKEFGATKMKTFNSINIVSSRNGVVSHTNENSKYIPFH